MKVIEHLESARKPIVSFEIVPPLRGGNIQNLLEVITHLAKYHPPFIDVTSHAAEAIYEETPQGIKRKVRRKRPGTLGLCALIQHQFNIDAVPHLLCRSFTREETEDFLIDAHYCGWGNVLALRGDDSNYQKNPGEGRSINKQAVDLVKQITAMNRGEYLTSLLDSRPSDFCIGVAGYPEKHYESPNLKTDIRYLKEKSEAGADYIVTQMFFDNQHYFSWVEKCQKEGIPLPIIPGLRVLNNSSQLQSIPRHFQVEIPDELSEEITAKPQHAEEIGIEWSVRPVEELLSRNVPAIHFFIMQNGSTIEKVLQKTIYK